MEHDSKTAFGGERFLPSADRRAGRPDLMERLGFATVDLGGEHEGRLVQFPGGPLTILNLVQMG